MKGSKHRQNYEQAGAFQISQGLDVSMPPSDIPDQRSPKMINFIYDPHSFLPTSRPGLTAWTLDATTEDIQSSYHWVKNSTTEYIIAFIDNELYYLDRARVALTAWVTSTAYVVGDERKNGGYAYTCISAHTSSATSEPGAGATWDVYWREDPVWVVQNAASFAVDGDYRPKVLPFNQKLLIAAGTKGLLYWTSPGVYGTITTGVTTIHPTIIKEIVSRVVINNVATGGLDSTYFSKVEDETGWTFTSAGGAVLVRPDYGRGVQVNGFGVFGDDLIVSLSSTSWQHLVRISVAGSAYAADTSLSWRTEKFLSETGAVGNGLMQDWDRSIFFMSRQGLEMISGSMEQYTELTTQKVGVPINSDINDLTPTDLKMIPIMGSVFMIFENDYRVWVYHPWGAGFTQLVFPEYVTSISQMGEDVLVSMGKHLYKFDYSSAVDEVVGGTDLDVTSIIRTKQVDTFDGTMLLKSVDVSYSVQALGDIELALVSEDDVAILASRTMQFPAPPEYTDFVTWLDDLYDSVWDFTGSGDPTRILFYGRARSRKFSLQLKSTGRFKLSNIKFKYAELT